MKTKVVLRQTLHHREEALTALKSFKDNFFDEEKVWQELVYCLCTPQTKAVNALKAVEYINRDMNVAEISNILRRCGVRFHVKKARYIYEAGKIFPMIYHRLKVGGNIRDLRDFLVGNVKGFGFKEASHFLRNIGFEDVAIIDRHIMRYMAANRLTEKKIKSMTKNAYLSLENRFIEHARKIGLSPALLDLLIWAYAVGRVLK